MFRHLKSNGFELESLHVEKAYKVKMMMAALVLAYCLSVVYGLKKYKRKVMIKKYDSPEMRSLDGDWISGSTTCKLLNISWMSSLLILNFGAGQIMI
jgi:hypothetical protein